MSRAFSVTDFNVKMRAENTSVERHVRPWYKDFMAKNQLFQDRVPQAFFPQILSFVGPNFSLKKNKLVDKFNAI